MHGFSKANFSLWKQSLDLALNTLIVSGRTLPVIDPHVHLFVSRLSKNTDSSRRRCFGLAKLKPVAAIGEDPFRGLTPVPDPLDLDREPAQEHAQDRHQHEQCPQ